MPICFVPFDIFLSLQKMNSSVIFSSMFLNSVFKSLNGMFKPVALYRVFYICEVKTFVAFSIPSLNEPEETRLFEEGNRRDFTLAFLALFVEIK